MGQRLNGHIRKEDIEMRISPKRCSTSLVTRKTNIKTTIIIFHYILNWIDKISKAKYWQECGAARTATHCWQELQIGTTTLENNLIILKVKKVLPYNATVLLLFNHVK